MSRPGMFESATNKKGNLGAFFEQADGTCYFYLCKIKDGKPNGVLGAIHITSKEPNFNQEDLKVKWNHQGDKVGLFIKEKVVAIFHSEPMAKFGENITPIIPEILESFE